LVFQVANMEASRAQELGETKYPSRATIYRVLEAEIEGRSQKEKAAPLDGKEISSKSSPAKALNWM
jgi:hypothetical protein